MPPTKIDWCKRVWNPVTGCSKVSEGCKNCYAESIARRFWHGRSFGDVQCHENRLEMPLHWKKPQIVFVNTMSDLFHEKVPFDFILMVWMFMFNARQHTYIILTKRPERMKIFVNEWLPGAWGLARKTLQLLDKPLPNVWLGVSVENQARADERIPLLLQTPAAKHIVSVEPMLESVDITKWLPPPPSLFKAGQINLDWVICGRETGPNARPFSEIWLNDLQAQCKYAGTDFWWKNHPGFQERPCA